MLNGNVQLSLMIGPVVPVPVGTGIVQALESVQVRTTAGQRSGFTLTFNIDADSVVNELLMLVGATGPFVRVVLIVTMTGTPHVLFDGVLTNVQTSPNVETGKSKVVLTGEDLTAVMDLIDFTGIPYPAMPPSARVAFILAKYAVYGIIPLVIPAVLQDVPIPTDNVPTHQGNDLAYVNQLAEEAGYVFYVEPGPEPLTNIGYWGPEIRVGPAQPALNVNMDTLTNVESLSFKVDNKKRVQPIVFIQNDNLRVPVPVPVPAVSLLKPPLGAVPPFPAKVTQVRDTSAKGLIRAALMGLSEASSSMEAVSGNGSLNVARYGHLLRARQLVGVRGAGDAFNGLYYVKSVTHTLSRGSFTTDFTLTRNGIISTVPTVPTD